MTQNARGVTRSARRNSPLCGVQAEKFSFSTTANHVKTYVKISPFHFIEKSPPDVARICEDWLNVFRLTVPSSGPWRRLKEGAKGTEIPI